MFSPHRRTFRRISSVCHVYSFLLPTSEKQEVHQDPDGDQYCPFTSTFFQTWKLMLQPVLPWFLSGTASFLIPQHHWNLYLLHNCPVKLRAFFVYSSLIYQPSHRSEEHT